MKNLLIAIVLLILLGVVGTYFYLNGQKTELPEDTTDVPMPVEPDGGIGDGAEPLPEVTDENISDERSGEQVIGTSAEGNEITAYHFGTGDTEVLFIGGIHGGYSFNTALVGFEIVDYLKENPGVVPENVMVTVIPVLNPDGLNKIVGTTERFDGSTVTTNDEARVDGRFNGNGVDLNRNFDCEWQTEGTWQNRTVDGGSAPFSEPEAEAVKNYVAEYEPEALVAYYSQAGGVYSATCKNGISAETTALTNTYAQAAEYPAHEEFDYYEITGDMVNWAAGEGLAAISVLLTNHENAEWNKNKLGVDSILNYYAE